MTRYREPFTIFPKKLHSGTTVFYFTTYDKFNRRKQFSTGCLSRSKAKKYCYDLFKTNDLIRKRSLRFSDYTKDWFIYDQCPYIQSILVRGRKYSRSTADHKRSQLTKSMLPYFGQLNMDDFKREHVEIWINDLRSTKRSNSTINHYLTTLKTIFNEAFRLGDIKENPLLGVKYLAKQTKVRTTLVENEVEVLFDKENSSKVWSKPVVRLATLLASQTGMRMGEILALQREFLKDDHIIVKHSWNKYYGLKGTKSGKTRIVPISKELHQQLTEHIATHDHNFVFSIKNKDRPIGSRIVAKYFYAALNAIGISEEERAERNVTFHSWRHYYNTLLIKRGIPIPIIQAIIGHSNNSTMTENYTKFSSDDLKVVLRK